MIDGFFTTTMIYASWGFLAKPSVIQKLTNQEFEFYFCNMKIEIKMSIRKISPCLAYLTCIFNDPPNLELR